jgi:hypothetical protein
VIGLGMKQRHHFRGPKEKKQILKNLSLLFYERSAFHADGSARRRIDDLDCARSLSTTGAKQLANNKG